MRKIIYGLLITLLSAILILALNLFIFVKMSGVISTGENIQQTGSGNTALLVLDLQEGTTGSTSTNVGYIEQSEALFHEVNRLTEEALEKGQEIIYIGSEVTKPLINLINSSMARGSEGAGFDARLDIRSEHVVFKHKSDAFHEEELNEMLGGMGVEKLLIVGLDAGQCVLNTTRGALNRGYHVAVFEEGIIAEDEQVKQEALEEFRKLEVEIK